MQINRQPRWHEEKFPNEATFIHRLFRQGERGRVGSHYQPASDYPQALPIYDNVKDDLPKVVIEDHPEWEELFNWTWQSLYDRHTNTPRPGSGFTANYIDAALDKNYYQWDACFINLYARYGHHIFPAINALDNFYAKQREDGLIWRIFSETDGSEMWWGNYPSMVNPPLFAWSELENLKISADLERIRRIMPALSAYTDWLQQGMRAHNSRHQLYWNSPDGSGMDNTPRHGSGWVDMSSQLVLNHRCMAELYQNLGDFSRAEDHSRQAQELSARINHWMWDEKDGFYYDLDNLGRRIKIKTIASYWPLIAGIASDQQARSLVDHLRTSFASQVPFPSLSLDHRLFNESGRYWQGGVWAPTSYMAIKGLMRYGYDQLAHDLGMRLLDVVSQVFDQTGTIWELYAPQRNSQGLFQPGTNKDGRTLCGPEFTGWTGLIPIAMLIEDIIGIRVDAVHQSLDWHIRHQNRHGIKNLRVGATTVSLIHESNGCLAIESDGELHLNIHRYTHSESTRIEAGRQKIKLA